MEKKEKIAILVSGAVWETIKRYGDTIESLERSFLDKDVDIYVGTWRTFPETNKEKQEYAYDTEELIKLFKQYECVKDVILCESFTDEKLTEMNFPYQRSVNKNHQYKIARYTSFCMFSMIKYLLDTLDLSKYTHLVRARIDEIIEIEDVDNWIERANSGKYVTPPNTWSSGTNDHFGIATRENFYKIWNYEKNDRLASYYDNNIDPEGILRNMCGDAKIEVVTLKPKLVKLFKGQ